MRHGGSLSRQHQEQPRQTRPQLDQHVEQEIEVFFVRDAADVHQHRTVGCDAMPAPERRTVAVRKRGGLDARRQHGDRPLDAVHAQDLEHRRRWHDEVVERVAPATRDGTRRGTQQAARQERHVVMEILFEMRVPGLHHRQPVAARPAHAARVGDEGCLHVHDVHSRGVDAAERTAEHATAHQPVFRVHRYAAGADPMHVGAGRVVGAVTRHDERAAVRSLGFDARAEGGDGGRNAVHSREKHVRDHQDVHAAPPLWRKPACQAEMTPR
jgi:hypothetical protein